jgi:hypothetical protein
MKRSGTAFVAADASSFPVVGVGASAGELAAVTSFSSIFRLELEPPSSSFNIWIQSFSTPLRDDGNRTT